MKTVKDLAKQVQSPDAPREKQVNMLGVGIRKGVRYTVIYGRNPKVTVKNCQ